MRRMRRRAYLVEGGIWWRRMVLVLGATLAGVARALVLGTMVVEVLGVWVVDVLLALLGVVVSAMLGGLAVGGAVARVMGAVGGCGGDGGVWVMGGDGGGSLRSR